MIPEDFDFEGWVNDHHNVMLVLDDNVGLATFEYPGVYGVHWYFGSARGRKAIELARSMLAWLFNHTDAQAIRGLTKANLKAARWASRQVGMTSYGIVECKTGEHELFCMTKEDFLKGKE
jgi:hypothetical protein